MNILRMLHDHYRMAQILFLRAAKKAIRLTGEHMKVQGRVLVALGEDTTPKWDVKLFYKCYLVDVEIHVPDGIYSGPIYALYQKAHSRSEGNIFIVKFNWLKKQTRFSLMAETTGFCAFVLEKCTQPDILPNGDTWFWFKDGYAIIRFSKARAREAFVGSCETPRVYNYY